MNSIVLCFVNKRKNEEVVSFPAFRNVTSSNGMLFLVNSSVSSIFEGSFVERKTRWGCLNE